MLHLRKRQDDFYIIFFNRLLLKFNLNQHISLPTYDFYHFSFSTRDSDHILGLIINNINIFCPTHDADRILNLIINNINVKVTKKNKSTQKVEIDIKVNKLKKILKEKLDNETIKFECIEVQSSIK